MAEARSVRPWRRRPRDRYQFVFIHDGPRQTSLPTGPAENDGTFIATDGTGKGAEYSRGSSRWSMRVAAMGAGRSGRRSGISDEMLLVRNISSAAPARSKKSPTS